MPCRSVQLLPAIIFGLTTAPAFSQTEYVAGTDPSRRPESAPVVTEVVKDTDWYSRALVGVEKPYPYSLRFLEDQGHWFTPFRHPGMTGPYDIRGWH